MNESLNLSICVYSFFPDAAIAIFAMMFAFRLNGKIDGDFYALEWDADVSISIKTRHGQDNLCNLSGK